MTLRSKNLLTCFPKSAFSGDIVLKGIKECGSVKIRPM